MGGWTHNGHVIFHIAGAIGILRENNAEGIRYIREQIRTILVQSKDLVRE